MNAVLMSMADFFEMLRYANIYDDSFIVIVGDHGKGTTSEVHINTPSHDEIPAAVVGHNRNFRRDKARAVPVVLVKLPRSSSEYQVSDAPVSAIDVPATVLHEIGIEADYKGVAMKKLQQDDPRVRRYAAFDFTASKGDYVGPIVMYRVIGDSWNDDSWSIEDLYHPPLE